MAELDTSGAVIGVDYQGRVRMDPAEQHWPEIYWSDLSPFAQGCVEAIFAGLEHPGYIDVEPGNTDVGHIPVGFRHLAPEALAMILRDTALADHDQSSRDYGRLAWADRQNGSDPHFPPLRVYLNDAGKVMLELAK